MGVVDSLHFTKHYVEILIVRLLQFVSKKQKTHKSDMLSVYVVLQGCYLTDFDIFKPTISF